MTRLLGLTQRMTTAYEGREKRDCLAHDWHPFMAAVGRRWIALPNDPEAAPTLAEALDLGGVILTGGDDIGVFPERDRTEAALVDWCRARSRPILGVCRGLQFLCSHFGGSLAGVDAGVHVAKRHGIEYGDGRVREVNSFHNFSPVFPDADASFPLRVAAKCQADGAIEAAAGEGIRGVMWHPEREESPHPEDVELFRRHFGDGRA